MSENVVQPGIEPGSPDYRSDALTTRPLNQPRMLRKMCVKQCLPGASHYKALKLTRSMRG